jgi:hypothetical protein
MRFDAGLERVTFLPELCESRTHTRRNRGFLSRASGFIAIAHDDLEHLRQAVDISLDGLTFRRDLWHPIVSYGLSSTGVAVALAISPRTPKTDAPCFAVASRRSDDRSSRRRVPFGATLSDPVRRVNPRVRQVRLKRDLAPVGVPILGFPARDRANR